jgi:amino acid adenylation domain-containing protein
LLFDGWSTPIILREFLAFYDAHGSGEPPRLEPARPYSEYIAWLLKQDRAEANAFWREKLRGFAAATPLVVDRAVERPSPTESSSKVAYAEEAFRLSATATAALQSLAREQRLTLNTIVQGAWGILLSRYSGEPDVVFGATVSGRPATLPGAESMVGLFINTLPVRVRADGEDLLVPWLKELQAQQVEREQHAHASLAEIQQQSDVPKGSPLFESIFVFESYPSHGARRERRGGGLEIRDLRSRERANYLLSVVVNPGDELCGRIIYDARRFEAPTIRRMVGHLLTLLEGIAVNPQARVGDLSMLTPAERHQLLIEWNDTKTDRPIDRCIHTLVEAQAARAPDAVAVVLGEERRTYGELNAAANQLARYLISLGVGAETRVAVCIESSVDRVVGLLGILKAGGCYVPLDPLSPAERLAFMIKDAQAHVVLTDARNERSFSSSSSAFSKQNTQVVCFARDWPRIAQLGEGDLNLSVELNSTVYMIYTSGSTGKPKGVRVPHSALLNFICWQQRVYGIHADDRATHLTNLAFDGSVFEIWSCLAAGAALYLVPRELVSDPARLRDFLVERAITVAFAPTPLAEQLVALAWPAKTALRLLLTGGDTLRVAPPASLPFTLINGYGPTESTVFATTCVVPPNGQALPPIGRPLDNVQVYILDERMRPTPIGVPGELCIAGDSLSLGYHERPELNAEKFIPNPFGPGSLYRSGDLARYSSNGDIEFVGRLDTQVKIRGFRIELGEIEALLGRHPRVREVAVITQGEGSVDKRLVAYVVPREEPPSLAELSDFLRVELPDYMIPTAIVLLSSMPMNPNGKVDRRALSSLDATPLAVSAPFVAPRTAAEETLAAIWREVLGAPQVGVHDDFFELGGHSLLATQVISRAREAFAMEIPLRHLFEDPTVARLAERIIAQQLEQADRDALEQLVNEIDALSDDEVREMQSHQGVSATQPTGASVQ